METLKKSSKTKSLVIAEVGQTHDGSLGLAHAFIDSVAKSGADGIKFQTHIADAETTREEQWRKQPDHPQDKSRFDYWQRMEFTEKQWIGLRKHADEEGLIFLSSPFSFEAFDLLSRVGVYAWKVASGEITNYPLLKRMSQSQKPLWISTGMSSYSEIEEICKILRSWNADFTLFQCTSAYPVQPEEVGLNNIQEFRNRYNCNVGLSDHSGTIFPSLAAATMGVDVIEVHVAFHKDMYGFDVSSSITFKELDSLVQGVNFISEMVNNPIVKNDQYILDKFSAMRSIFMKRIVTNQPVRKGEILTEDHLTTKKSDKGISAMRWDEIIGKRVSGDFPNNYFLRSEDIGE
jgi:N,N'-diacetyllegionaminate synthase